MNQPPTGYVQRTFHFFDGGLMEVWLDTETNARLNADWSEAGGRRAGIGTATQSLAAEPSSGCFTYPYIEYSAYMVHAPADGSKASRTLSVRLSDVRLIS